MLARAEDFAVATLSYPMSITTYLNVTNFHLFKGDSEEPEVAFSFIPLEEREDTAYSGNAYRFHEALEGYAPATTVISQCLEGIYQPSLVTIKALFNPLLDMSPLVEYGFYPVICQGKVAHGNEGRQFADGGIQTHILIQFPSQKPTDDEKAAALKQIQDIRYIESELGLEKLPPLLKETAEVRLANPDTSLAGLGEMLAKPLGKSGVNARLKKLCEIADKLRSGDEIKL